MRIANEILMFFRSQKKMGCEVSIHETIDTDKDGNPLTYLDIISVPDTITETVDLSVHLERVRYLIDRVLDEREKQIIVLRYGLEGFSPRTQREVASFMKISRSYVSRIEKKALEKLREHFGERPDFND